MLRIVVHLTLEDGTKGRDLEVPAEVGVQELAGLIGRALFPSSGDVGDNQPFTWSLHLASGGELDSRRSLAEQGIFDGAHLVLGRDARLSPPKQSAVWWLESGTGRQYPLLTDRVVLGRAVSGSSQRDSALIDLGGEPYGRMVSRAHAWLVRDDQGWRLAPVSGATNGTLVNGVLVPAGRETRVKAGDRIQLARVGLVLHCPSGASDALDAPIQAHAQPCSADRASDGPTEYADPGDRTRSRLRDVFLVVTVSSSLLTGAWAMHLHSGARPAVAQVVTPSPEKTSTYDPVSGVSTALFRSSPLGRGVVIETPLPTMTAAAPTPLRVQSMATPLPTAFRLEGIPIGQQAKKLSCELQTASDLAWFYGQPYTWEEIFLYVGHDPGGNPHVGFVGRSLNDSPGQLYPYGYGVYAEPIAAALCELGLDARVHYGESRRWLQERIAAGHPVMVWAVGGMRVAPVEEWVAADGSIVQAVRFEHTFLVVGYQAEGVWVHDPWDAKQRFYSWEQFEASWDVLDRMALSVYGRLVEKREWRVERPADAS